MAQEKCISLWALPEQSTAIRQPTAASCPCPMDSCLSTDTLTLSAWTRSEISGWATIPATAHSIFQGDCGAFRPAGSLPFHRAFAAAICKSDLQTTKGHFE